MALLSGEVETAEPGDADHAGEEFRMALLSGEVETVTPH